ncbi:MAG: hypothetical protein WC915_01855 [archaeon]|jgi:hypothetical protein
MARPNTKKPLVRKAVVERKRPLTKPKTTKEAKNIVTVHEMLKEIVKTSDPRKHANFAKLNYSSLKKMGFPLKRLHHEFHIQIGDLYRIKVPVKELIKEFGLKEIISYTEFANPNREVIPMRALRASGVTAKQLLAFPSIPFGAAYHKGGYTKQELFDAGVNRENLARLGKKGSPLSKPPTNVRKVK